MLKLFGAVSCPKHGIFLILLNPSMNLAPERRLYNSNVTASSVSYMAWVSLVPVYWGQTCLFVFNWHSWWFIRTSRCIWLKFWIAFGCLPLNPCPHVVQWNDPWLHTAHQMCTGFIFVYIYCGCSIFCRSMWLGPLSRRLKYDFFPATIGFGRPTQMRGILWAPYFSYHRYRPLYLFPYCF